MLELKACRIAVTGGGGFLGRRIVESLHRRGCRPNLVTVIRRADYDLTKQAATCRMFDDVRPEIVIHAAADVGGIGANAAHPGRFYYNNLAMGLNVIEESRARRLRKLVFIGTTCSYPGVTDIPIRESFLWDGYPEPTNAPYGIAKRSLIVMLDAYRREYGLASTVVLPANLYGPGDNFDPMTSHVIPALIRRFIEAQQERQSFVRCWGTGHASREFLYVDDAADGIVIAAERMESPHAINLGTGREIRIKDIAKMIADMVGYHGAIEWDESKPDGQLRRCLDVTSAKELLDWKAATDLAVGLRATIDWYRTIVPTANRA